jgi:signal recognition particle subunit SRP54
MAAVTQDDLLEAIDKMTVLELSEFIKRFEERYGVTAAAPVAVAAAPAAGGAAAATDGAAAAATEEQTEFSAVLTEVGPNKIPVIKVVRELTQLGLKEAKDLVDAAPKPVKEGIERDEAEKLAAKMQKGEFTLDDLASQFRQLRKMGGMGGVMGMLPGIGKIKKQLDEAKLDDGMIKRQEAIISSMTARERRNPKLLNASRRRRIALGSGTTVQDVNRLLKQHQDMADMMKKVSKMGKKGLMRGGLSSLLPRGGGFR